MQRNQTDLWPFYLRPLTGCLVLSGCLWCADASAATPALAQAKLTDLTLEELANIQVVTVSKKPESLSETPAALYVITAQDIRRSGAMTLPEALRLAPNLQVARNTAGQYAITARGFNSTSANKLLVLIDGRIVYTPLYSGVFWDVQDVALGDVERIEVISGPGGALWGANAVNGIINVITRNARDTQGSTIAVTAGSTGSLATARYGGALNNGGHYRVYGNRHDWDNTERANGTEIKDSGHLNQTGFRTDWGGGAESMTVQGDAYDGRIGQAAALSATVQGANLLGRWQRTLSDSEHMQLQAYYDYSERDHPAVFAETLHVFDIEFQHSFSPRLDHSLVWGGGYRLAHDDVTNSAVLAFLPAQITQHWSNLFVQDEIRLRDGLMLTVGSKAQRNDYTGFALLPSVRLAWKPAPDQLVWSALSRSVREPSRLDRDLYAPGQPPFTFLAGGPNFRSETADTFELGYRSQPSKNLSYSITAFHSRYRHLRTFESSTKTLDNKMAGYTSGLETWGTWQVQPGWRLAAGLTLLRERLHLVEDSTDVTGPAGAGNDPAHTWMIRSMHDLSSKQQFDLTVRGVGALPNPAVPAYVAVDFRFGWMVSRDLELSFGAQDLFDAEHPEFGTSATRSEIGRNIYVKLDWHL
ncbi:MAG: TonB-dependent receptor [Burkholderiaceae bacterium]|nr:MAG: TonB-dependent receptor [Burkholderiaceae bacterium]